MPNGDFAPRFTAGAFNAAVVFQRKVSKVPLPPAEAKSVSGAGDGAVGDEHGAVVKGLFKKSERSEGGERPSALGLVDQLERPRRRAVGPPHGGFGRVGDRRPVAGAENQRVARARERTGIR